MASSQTSTSSSPSHRLAAVFRGESIGGLLLAAATVAALVVANSPWSEAYLRVRDSRWGPEALHLHLSVGGWAADGLLAVFFFVVGLELKRELLAGELRDVRHALVPVAAAVGGVLAPVAVYLAVLGLAGGGSPERAGWAIPAATDIAFALAVLAVVARGLPSALRVFLMTLAVVDDLIAISIIAFGFTDGLSLPALVGAVLTWGLFALAVRRFPRWWVLVPLGFAVWAWVHASGVHATIAGVLLGITFPVFTPGERPARGASHEEVVEAGEHGPAATVEHAWSPWSAALAVPVFAFFAAGVPIDGFSALVDAVSSPVATAIIVALVIGKPLGILGGAFLVTRFSRLRLADGLTWAHLLGLGLLGGIGFTVSLLIGELAFGVGTAMESQMKVGVLLGSVIAAALAAVVLRAVNQGGRPSAPGSVEAGQPQSA